MHLYKYMSEKTALRFASELQIRFSPPLIFNDPFEMRPAFTKAEYDNICKGLPEDMKNGFKNFVSEWLHLTIARSISSKIGILSLSETPTDILMWAHYAEMHRGVVVEFYGSHEFFTSLMYRNTPQFLQKVIYSDNRVSVGIDYMRDFPSRDHYGHGYAHLFRERHPILFTKSSHWAYEREWRLIRQNLPPSEGSTRAWVEARESGRHYDKPDRSQLTEIPAEAISGFILGVACRRPSAYAQHNGLEEDLRERIEKSAALSHIRFYKVALDSTKFLLRLFDLDSKSDIEQNLPPIEFAHRMSGFIGRPPTRP